MLISPDQKGSDLLITFSKVLSLSMNLSFIELGGTRNKYYIMSLVCIQSLRGNHLFSWVAVVSTTCILELFMDAKKFCMFFASGPSDSYLA